MLTHLQIKNFVFIDDITLEFDPRLNALTGETGAGKSILIDSLRFALGDRLDTEKIGAAGADKTIRVEATFDLPKFLRKLEALEPFLEADEDTLILTREVAAGKSRYFVNHRLVTLALLKEIGKHLVDIHGQYDHQLILESAHHLALVDRFAGNDKEKDAFEKIYTEYHRLQKSLAELAEKVADRERDLDFLKYQITEIERLDLNGLDEEALTAERNRLTHAEKISEAVAKAIAVLDEDEITAASLMSEAEKNLSLAARYDASLENLKTSLEGSRSQLDETLRDLKAYQSNLVFDQDRLAEVEKTLDHLELLKKKYGSTIEAVRQFLKDAKAKFNLLENSEVHQSDLEREIKAIEPPLKKASAKLSDSRRAAGEKLRKEIEKELADLRILDAKFKVEVTEKPYAPGGADTVEFFASLNVGEALHPLAKVASGGEVSRVMLALKKALMKADPVPTLVFDEIDANIGGRLGAVTGKKLKEISEKHQVLLVTHLPQIASFADKHFKVSKEVRDGRTRVTYGILEGEKRVKELAQMMSGFKETDTAHQHAKELLEQQ